MKTVHHNEGEVPWTVKVPDKGWMIENGKLTQYPGDEAFHRARDPEKGSGQVFWDRDVAVEQFNAMYDKDASVKTPIK